MGAGRLTAVAVIGALAAMTVVQLPEIRRYLKIRAM
jgi:hypothetical protein